MYSVFKKNKRWGIPFLIAVSLLVSACAVTKLYQHPALALSGPDSATVHILRPDAFAAKLVSLPVSFNQIQLLEIKNASYTTVYLQPGSYTVRVNEDVKPSFFTAGGSIKAGRAQIELVVGTTYYLLILSDARTTRASYGKDQLHFMYKTALISQVDGEKLRNKLEYIEVTPDQ